MEDDLEYKWLLAQTEANNPTDWFGGAWDDAQDSSFVRLRGGASKRGNNCWRTAGCCLCVFFIVLSVCMGIFFSVVYKGVPDLAIASISPACKSYDSCLKAKTVPFNVVYEVDNVNRIPINLQAHVDLYTKDGQKLLASGKLKPTMLKVASSNKVQGTIYFKRSTHEGSLIKHFLDPEKGQGMFELLMKAQVSMHSFISPNRNVEHIITIITPKKSQVQKLVKAMSSNTAKATVAKAAAQPAAAKKGAAKKGAAKKGAAKKGATTNFDKDFTKSFHQGGHGPVKTKTAFQKDFDKDFAHAVNSQKTQVSKTHENIQKAHKMVAKAHSLTKKAHTLAKKAKTTAAKHGKASKKVVKKMHKTSMKMMAKALKKIKKAKKALKKKFEHPTKPPPSAAVTAAKAAAKATAKKVKAAKKKVAAAKKKANKAKKEVESMFKHALAKARESVQHTLQKQLQRKSVKAAIKKTAQKVSSKVDKHQAKVAKKVAKAHKVSKKAAEQADKKAAKHFKSQLAAAQAKAQAAAQHAVNKLARKKAAKKLFFESHDDFNSDESRVFPHHVARAEPYHSHEIFSHRVYRGDDY